MTEQTPDTTAGEHWPNGATEWQRVSNAYAWADLVPNLIVVAAAGVASYFLLAVVEDAPIAVKIIVPAVAVILLINALLAFRRVRAIGYILREDDLLFRRGIMFERVIAVPYGRLQLVDVTRGPILRALGLATLKFVTASAATGVQLPGLRAEEAEALRDRLVKLAETRRSGL
ncbi:PH domain-containing protein [Leucobacter sp. CSA2]|uniref:PH domain-containing protein n=1 Tax=Leucobacter edaphi TaxID=2796472 RepID=A0A934QE79_9MICO|nr:PH domain-containing protein [Leucobacter edaphi]MBK0422698.1 PH domain-containing protein [Leucobacter edaphi]